MPTILIDYGHGEDTWENGGGKGVRKDGKVYEEHHFNADVGERIRKILEAHGVKVILSQPPHGKDVGPTHRVNLIKKYKPTMTVSIHANAGIPSVSGACVFAWKGATNSNKMADLVVKHMKKEGIEFHGNGRHYSELNSWTNLFMTREPAKANLPSILIEHGFMTNSKDFENIFGTNKEKYREKCARADAKAILEYCGIKYDSGETQEVNKPQTINTLEGIGTVVVKVPELNYRADKDLNSRVIKKLYEGELFYVYDVDGKWFKLGVGWASAGSDGSLLEFTPHPKPKPQPQEPKKAVYRVIVNGEQVGAYSEDSNVLAQIREAMGHMEDDIKIEKV